MQNVLLTGQTAQWYAIYTRSRAEKKLYAMLQQKDVECFLPLRKTLSQRSDRKKWVDLPLLPSYLFVKITEREYYPVLNTPGAVCYVSFGGRAVPIPEEQITSLNQFVDNNSHDVEVHYGDIATGNVVEVECGPLKGMRGEVVQIRGKERLLLRFVSLGCCIHIEASRNEIRKQDEVPSQHCLG